MKKEKRKSELKLLGCGARNSSLQKEVEKLSIKRLFKLRDQERRIGESALARTLHIVFALPMTFLTLPFVFMNQCSYKVKTFIQ